MPKRRSRLSWRVFGPVAAAWLLGAAVPLSGFQPLDHSGDVLNVDSTPWHVIAMPATLIALASLVVTFLLPRQATVPAPRWLVIGACLLMIGACLSLLQSDQGKDTLAQIITAVVAPIALFVGLRRSAVPVRVVALVFAAVAAVLLLRADIVFFAQKGLPTGTHLLQAKQSYEPGDFHYYGLQNPVGTSIFSVTVLAFGALWFLREQQQMVRIVLAAVSLIAILTLCLLYERIGILIGLLITGYVLLKLPGRRRWGIGGIAILIVALAIIAGTGPGVASQLGLLHTSSETRSSSLGPGVRAIVRHPLTGNGLGWSSQAISHRVAHSSVIQAGVEMGVFGLAGVGVLTAGFLASGWRALRDGSLDGMHYGALVAAGLYALYTLIAGGVNAGINDGLVSVWALAIALLAAIGFGDERRLARGVALGSHEPRSRVRVSSRTDLA
jgi:O-antigen ligase